MAPPIMVVALVVVARAILALAVTAAPLANAARVAFKELAPACRALATYPIARCSRAAGGPDVCSTLWCCSHQRARVEPTRASDPTRFPSVLVHTRAAGAAGTMHPRVSSTTRPLGLLLAADPGDDGGSEPAADMVSPAARPHDV